MLPTTAISADAPSSITYSSDTIDVVGKYTWVIATPDSYSTWPSLISTGSSSGQPALPLGIGQRREQTVLPRFGEGSHSGNIGRPVCAQYRLSQGATLQGTTEATSPCSSARA